MQSLLPFHFRRIYEGKTGSKPPSKPLKHCSVEAFSKISEVLFRRFG